MLLPGEVIIHSGNYKDYLGIQIVGGDTKKMGLIPRDWGRVPCGSMPGVPVAALPKIPQTEWSERIKELVDRKALLSDVRMTAGIGGGMIPSRDQNGRGYCWAHSTVSAAILARAKANLPFADLSAYAIACIIKGYRDEGGWNGESMKFLRERGCPTSKTWPQQGVSRSYDTPETWVEAALYKDTEWEDIPDRDFDQLMTYMLIGVPCPIDLNWWEHSVCAADPVDGVASRMMTRMASGKLATFEEFNAIWEMHEVGGGYGVRIWNSWSDSWSTNGMGVLTKSKATPDGSIALRVMRAA